MRVSPTCQYPRVDGALGTGAGPLRGIRVIDLSDGVAGPFCTKVLADYGAEVIKIEPPAGDPTRRMGPFREAADDGQRQMGGLFLHLNTNKLGAVVDLDQPGGAGVVRDLVAGADIVVESGRPGRLEALGIGPSHLIQEHPGLVVSSITPFGQTGPYRDHQMTEIVAFAMGGPMNSSGNPAREPVKLVGNIIQMQSGSTAATATLGALYHALEHNVGQHVDVATYETQNGSLDRRRYYLLSYQYAGHTTQRANVVGAGRIAAGGRFEARDGRLITTGRIWPTHLSRMVTVLGDEQLAALFAAKGEAMMAEDAQIVNQAIGRWAAARDARAAMREAQAAGWPVVVVNDPATLLDDEHLLARGFWVTAPAGTADALTYCGAPWRIDGGGWALRRTAPRLGEHTDQILTDDAGYSPEHIRALHDQGVVA
jgi:crotonobetainyl-CoA:carnitine CoA-transferase CaiB-like acyl-CoA transferase